MQIKLVVGRVLGEFDMLKLSDGMMMSVNTSKKIGDYGNCGKQEVLTANKCTKRVVYSAKKVGQEPRFTEVNTENDCNKSPNQLKKMKVQTSDVIGDKCVKDKDYNLVLGDKEKTTCLESPL